MTHPPAQRELQGRTTSSGGWWAGQPWARHIFVDRRLVFSPSCNVGTHRFVEFALLAVVAVRAQVMYSHRS